MPRQRTYRATNADGNEKKLPYQFLFTNQAMYLLVFDFLAAKQDTINLLDYWIQQISQCTTTEDQTNKKGTQSVDILLVGTNIDNPQCDQVYLNEVIHLLEERFPTNRYPTFRGIVSISLKSRKSMKELKYKLSELAGTIQPVVNPNWLLVHQQLLGSAPFHSISSFFPPLPLFPPQSNFLHLLPLYLRHESIMSQCA